MFEQKCPHCSHIMSFFSKELNSGGKEKTCPECNGQYTIQQDYKKMARIAIPIVLIMAVLSTALTFPNHNTSPITLLIMALPGVVIGYYKAMSLKPIGEKTSA